MAANDKRSTAQRWIKGIALTNLVMTLIGFVGLIMIPLELEPDIWIIMSSIYIGGLVYNILAMLILARRPKHRIGWLFLVIGTIYALAALDAIFFALALTLPIQSELLRGLIELFLDLALTTFLSIPVTLVLLYFPDGQLASRRWWPIALASWIGIIGQLIVTLFSPIAQTTLNASNPFMIAGIGELLGEVGRLSRLLLTIGTFGALASLVVRFRQAPRSEKTQMKWLVYTAVVSIIFLTLFGQIINQSPVSAILFFWPITLALAIGIAITRYRLYDIDIIIRRTLQYALLTGLLALVYFGSVVMLQSLAENLTGEQSPIVIVLSTLSIAALFNPLRIRIQDFIDRRFYRQKYDAEQALANFAAISRDEVDMEKLTAALIGVLKETMQSENLSMWLKEGGGQS